MYPKMRCGMWMFEAWLLRFKIRIVLGVIVLFLVSLLMSCEELNYLTFGKTVDATVVKDRIEIEVRRGEKFEKRVLGYSFVDKDNTRTEYENVALDWDRPEGTTVKVQYISGRQYLARLAGEHHWGWLSLFALSIAGLGVGYYVLSREE